MQKLYPHTQSVVTNAKRTFETKNGWPRPHFRLAAAKSLITPDALSAAQSYTASQLASIYTYPTPSSTRSNVIGVISLGGSLFGTMTQVTSPGAPANTYILTNGDVQTYWTMIGIPLANMPTVIVQFVDGNPENVQPGEYQGGDIENVIDISTIGACCPTANTTIILYVVQAETAATFDDAVTLFVDAITAAVTDTFYKPTIGSISWGVPESTLTSTQFTSFENEFIAGLNNSRTGGIINFSCSAGDSAASDGLNDGQQHVDYPGSSQYVTCCGGTTLNCPTLTYAGTVANPTTETAWSWTNISSDNFDANSGTGGGISKQFPQPSYQAGLPQFSSGRAVPDIAGNADPNVGSIYLYSGFGGVNAVQGGMGGQLSVGGPTALIVGGTSIVAPSFAGFLAACPGSGGVGIKSRITPQLYSAFVSLPSPYHDITTGTNGTYSAGAGYDAVTGLGTINGTNLAPLLV